MYNQGNYQQFGQRLPAVPLPPPPQLQQGPQSQAYLIPQHSYSNTPQNSNWNQNQQISPPIHPPRIPPPTHPQGQHFYRVPPPPLLPGGILPPPPTSSYFTPAPFGSLGHLQLPLPPPPPPSSPPPGPPPLPPSPPHESLSTDAELSPSSRKPSGADMNGDNLNSTAVNDSDTGVKDTSDFNIMSGIPPPKPRDEKTVRKIELLCQYIAKNGNEFEKWTCQKEIDNPEYKFLFGGPPGSEAAISHEYFKWVKKKCSSSESLDGSHTRDVSHSPDGSDMDMEDDITQPNEVDIKVEELACDSQHISHKDATDGKIFVSESLEVNQSDASRVPGELTEGTNPISLIQGYASDDSSENDDGLHFENVSPVAVSPHVKEDTTVLHALETDIESKNSSEPKSGTLSAPVVEGSLNTASKLQEPSTRTEDFKGDDTGDRKHGGAHKEESNAKLEVDEFGRVVKAGGISDSDSDDYRRRRGKRGRSRSRSRSPNGRRRRSPRRRRGKRSRSRSWSPKKRSRSRSRSPYRHREETGADRTRRNKSRSQICNDFRQGRCYRGAACHLFHESEKNDEFRRHKNKHQYNNQEVSDRTSDKVKEEFVDPSGQFEEVNSIDPPEQPVTESVTPPHIPIQLPPPVPIPSTYPLLSAPPPSTWNPLPLPPPPPRPQIGGPLLQYHQNQPPPHLNYPYQPFFRPELPLQQPYFGQSRILTHYNPYASTFDQSLTTNFSQVISQDTGTSHKYGQNQYDPLSDSIEPSSNLEGNTKQKEKDADVAASLENDEFGETGDAEVGAVENDSPSSPIDLPDVATGEVEIDQVKNPGKIKKNKDSRSMKLFKVSLAEFVKEVLKPSWRQGNMSKEAFKTIVKKTVDKVSGAIKKHQIPKSQAKINQYIDSSQRKLTKLVMGYVDKYVKV